MTPHRALWVAAAVLAVAAVVSFALGGGGDPLARTRTLAVPLAQAIPTEHRGWRMVADDELGERQIEMTKVDDYVSRRYADDGGHEVVLYVAYHGNRDRGISAIYHNATVCYPAAGWELQDETFDVVTLADAAQELPVCRYTFGRRGDRLSVLAFFRVGEELLDQSPRNKSFWLLTDRLTPALGEDPGTFVQVQVVARAGAGDPVAAAALQTRFLRDFGAAILRAVE